MVFKAYNFKSLKYDLRLVVFQNISREVFKDSHKTNTREKFLLLRPITTEGNRVMYQSEFQTITCNSIKVYNTMVCFQNKNSLPSRSMQKYSELGNIPMAS